MSAFSIKRAAFAGYGLIRQKPGLFIALALAALVVNFLGYWLLMSTVGPILGQVAQMARDGDMAGMADQSFALRMAGASLQMSAVLILIALVTYVLSAGAVTRAMVRPAKSVAPYIGLGGGEMRQLLAGIVIGGLLFLVILVFSSVFGIVGVIVASARGEMQQMVENPGSLPPTMAVFSYGGATLAYLAAFLLGVRFSLAPAQSEHEESTKIFGSWGLSKGRFGPMAGAYLLAILTLVPFYLLVTVFSIFTHGSGGDTTAMMRTMMQPDWSKGSVLAPTVLIFIILNALVSTLAWIVTLGSSTSVYVQTVGTASTADDDDDDDDDDED